MDNDGVKREQSPKVSLQILPDYFFDFLTPAPTGSVPEW